MTNPNELSWSELWWILQEIEQTEADKNNTVPDMEIIARGLDEYLILMHTEYEQAIFELGKKRTK